MPRKGEGNCVSTFPCDLKKKVMFLDERGGWFSKQECGTQ